MLQNVVWKLRGSRLHLFFIFEQCDFNIRLIQLNFLMLNLASRLHSVCNYLHTEYPINGVC